MTDCECVGPGFCKRHGITKNARWFELCRTNERYRKAWDEGRGPGQVKADGKPASKLVASGPGSELKKLFRSWGISACKACAETSRKMDAMGVDWCLGHVDELAAEIHANAEKRGWTALLSHVATWIGVEGPVVCWAIRQACERARAGEQKE